MEETVRFILRRLGFYLIAFWASITLNFLLPRFMPGDPVSRMFARTQGKMQPEQIDALRKLLGVDDRPIWEQYIDYLHNICHGQHGHFDLPLPHPGHRGHRVPDRLDPPARRNRTGDCRRRR
jgi:ABC-type dipeptide/oligopeptide/nickel transport system permease component